jgi:hypothetical protein
MVPSETSLVVSIYEIILRMEAPPETGPTIVLLLLFRLPGSLSLSFLGRLFNCNTWVDIELSLDTEATIFLWLIFRLDFIILRLQQVAGWLRCLTEHKILVWVFRLFRGMLGLFSWELRALCIFLSLELSLLPLMFVDSLTASAREGCFGKTVEPIELSVIRVSKESLTLSSYSVISLRV